MSEKIIRFNYIITIHNKESLIKDVMMGVINSAGINSTIYPVFDGCTDSSEGIVDEVMSEHPAVKIIKLYADDVHELKTINIGLSNSDQTGLGYNIIIQDDVVLQDPNLEDKCIALYAFFEQLGILSFRHGGNISREKILDRAVYSPLQDYVQNECGHYPTPETVLNLGYFTFKEAAIKSPICIPFKIIREIGMPDEAYMPWDDLAYCYKVSSAGYANGVFALNFVSRVSWGTTRTKKQTMEVEHVQVKNLDQFRAQYADMEALDEKKYSNKKYFIYNENLF